MGEANNVIRDDDNIWTWPQTLTMYPDQMTAEVWGPTLNSIGGHWGIKDCVLGLYFSNSSWYNPYAPMLPDQKLDLFLAQEMNGMPLGAMLSVYGASHTKDYTVPATDKTTTSATGLGISLGVTLMEKLEASFSFATFSWTDEDAAGDMVTEPAGNTDIMVGARYWMEMSDRYTLIPYAAFAFGGAGGKDAAKNEIDSSYSTITLGLGNNIHVGEDVLLVSDVGIQMNPSSVEMKPATGESVKEEMSSTLMPYYRAGLEATISKKLTLRLGAVKEWTKDVEKDDDNEETMSYAGTRLYLGAGYHLGNFSLDAEMDPGFLTRGPYFISGTPGTLAYMVSLRYIWAE
jgi:hypothetical protein